LSGLLFLFRSFVARLGRRIGKLHRHAIRQPEIDDGDVAARQLVVALEPGQPIERLVDIEFRQPHFDAIAQPQVPAPVGDQHRRPHIVAQRREPIEQCEEFPGAQLRAVAHHQRKVRIGRRHVRLEHGAVTGDHPDPARLLPQGERFALGDRDHQAIGQQLLDGRFRDPGIGLEAGAGIGDIEEQERGASGYAGGGENFLAAEMVLPRQRHRRDIEADDIRRHVADIAEKIEHHVGVAATHGAIARAHGDDRYGSREPGTPRQPRKPIRHAVEPAVDAAPPALRLQQSYPAAAAPVGTASPRNGNRRSGPGRLRRLGSIQRSSAASSTIHETSSSKVIPAKAASSGTRDVSVIPGCVLTSRQTKP